MKLFALLLFGSVTLFAVEPFISAEKLNTLLPQGKMVVLDVGTKEDYLTKGHIPGALNTKITEWRMPVEKYFVMRPEAELVKKISELGVSNDSMVVLYGHNQPKEILMASYIALTLKTLGHDNVTILNGGFVEWAYDTKRAVSHQVESMHAGTFIPAPKKNIVVDRGFALKNLNKIPMVEARPPQFYFGLEESEGVRRKGHISGGSSYFWKNSFEADETVKSADALKEILVQGMQLDPSKEMMVYCTGGLEASMNWYVLTQVLNFKDVKIYDASLKEWGNRDDTPMSLYRWESCKKN
jgi:thiosulfate/3-mercaptopyruvate sulfurtransferase